MPHLANPPSVSPDDTACLDDLVYQGGRHHVSVVVDQIVPGLLPQPRPPRFDAHDRIVNQSAAGHHTRLDERELTPELRHIASESESRKRLRS